MLQKKLTRRVLIGEEGRLFIEECTNSLVQGIYTTWMVMIKLKRWSLCVHGCVDGFSRKILLLVSSSTNNDPIVIGNCFLQCIKKTKIVPVVSRMDKFRQNIFYEDLQLFFTGTDDSYIYAASTRNQQIQSFWSRLKTFRTNWWFDFFTRMVNEGVHRPQLAAHVHCLLLCFLPIIKVELNDVVKT